MERAKKNVEVEAQVIARGNVVPMMTETESAETVQYVSDEDAAREDRLVSEIRMITEQTKQVVLFNSRIRCTVTGVMAKRDRLQRSSVWVTFFWRHIPVLWYNSPIHQSINRKE